MTCDISKQTQKRRKKQMSVEGKRSKMLETTVRMKPVDRDGPSIEIFKEAANGKVVIGRGEFLRCADKKVSRVHAELELETDGTFYLTPLHVNPCFLYKGGNEESKEELQKGRRQRLENGDHFSLLPASFVYAVVLEANVTASNDANTYSHGSTQLNETAKTNGSNEISPMGSSGEDEKRVKTSGNSNNEQDNDEPFASQFTARKRSLPSWLLDTRSETDSPPAASTTNNRKGGPNKRNKTEVPSTSRLKDKNGDKNGAAERNKGSPSDADDEEEREITSDAKKHNEAAVNVKGRKRSNCRFGNNCYRKNTAHFEEFSHPGDSDYASEDEDDDPDDENDPRPECEYGLSCYRKNSQHRFEYKHSTRSRPQRRAARNGKKKMAIRDDASDNSDSFDDSFIDDDSDEYKPSKDDADYSGDEEDLKALNKEAKEFINNSKFH